MGRIYQHAQCTIAAVHAKDSHGGLFQERNGLELTCCQLIGSQRGGRYKLWATDIAQWGLQRPLYERAWVMQEQCLSRRLLEFNSNSISWKCISSTASEDDPSLGNYGLRKNVRAGLSGRTERMLTILDDQESIGNFKALSSRDLDELSEHWIQTWWSVIEDYTQRDLTYVTDRAAAISGLIDLITEARRTPVAYGILVPYLVSDLLWCASTPAQERVAIEYPSWSWFGVGVGIKYKLSQQWPSKILDSGTATVSIDKTAKLERAGILNKVLKITAHMVEVRQSGPLPEIGLRGYVVLPIRTRYVFWLRDGLDQKQGCERLKDLEDGQWFPDTTFDPKRNLMAVQFIFREIPWYRESMGLMVVPVDEEARVYSRVGWYSIRWDIEKGKHKYKTFYKRADPWKKHRQERWGKRQTIWLV